VLAIATRFQETASSSFTCAIVYDIVADIQSTHIEIEECTTSNEVVEVKSVHTGHGVGIQYIR
jgi:hypothetical protein